MKYAAERVRRASTSSSTTPASSTSRRVEDFPPRTLGRDHRDQPQLGASTPRASRCPAMKRAQLGPHHQHRLGARPGRLGAEVGLCRGQARHRRPHQGRRRWRPRRTGITVQRDLPRLGADAAGAKADRRPRRARQASASTKPSAQLLGEKQPSLQFTTPEELGELAVFLCSPAARQRARRGLGRGRRLDGAVEARRPAQAGTQGLRGGLGAKPDPHWTAALVAGADSHRLAPYFICTDPLTVTDTTPLPGSTGSASSALAAIALARIVHGRGTGPLVARHVDLADRVAAVAELLGVVGGAGAVALDGLRRHLGLDLLALLLRHPVADAGDRQAARQRIDAAGELRDAPAVLAFDDQFGRALPAADRPLFV